MKTLLGAIAVSAGTIHFMLDTTGLVDIALDVKAYVKSVYNSTSSPIRTNQQY